jgi:cohesin complex subunit SCC1
MFYSENILVKKGPLANVWLAANWDRKLSKTQILHTDIAGTVQDLVSGELPPMALRLSGQLLLGVSKIYGRQARYLLEDCGEALSRFQESKSGTTNSGEASAAPVQRLKSTTIKAQELLAKQEEEPEFNVEYSTLF